MDKGGEDEKNAKFIFDVAVLSALAVWLRGALAGKTVRSGRK